MKVYLKTILMLIKMQLEYRKAFIISVIGSFLITFLLTISVYFLFEEFNQIGDWTFYEVAFLFGMVFLNFSLSEMFLRGLDHFDNVIKNGEFDRILIRPQNALLQSTCMEFDFSKIGRMVQCICVIVIALLNINIDWNLFRVLVFVLMNLGCFIIFLGIFILKASFCFWTVDGLEFMNILAEGGKKVAQYPIDIYAKWFRIFFTFIVPFGLVNYYPVLYLFGKVDNFYYGFIPIFTVIFLIPCICVWKIGVKHYESTGS
ncbi:MAG: ABC transporter permease [Clostridia bacterium]